MKKILYISGTRADYGLMRETLFSIRKHPGLKLEIVATGMHLMPEFGKTVNEIKKDGFKVREVYAVYKKDDKESMAVFIGDFVKLLVKKVKEINPDIILVLGDRAEMLAGAIVGAYLMIPVVHIHGGDVTGNVDEIIRHAITKLSHVHLTATKKSRQRVIKMGEERGRVFVVGAPGLDDILSKKLISNKRILKKYNLDFKTPILLVIQHPAIFKAGASGKQMRETMEAVKEFKFQAIVVYPNADAGGREMIKIIHKYRKYPFIKIYKNIPRTDYLSLMRVSSALVGNSSSGIIEAPAFKLPVVNIGDRQLGREKSDNVIDVGYDKEKIKAAIRKAVYNERFIAKVRKCKNPYGSGKASVKITNILGKVKISGDLFKKKITY